MTAPEPWFGKNESPPQEGGVLVLNYHHDGESHWCSPEQAIARIEHILDGGKPEDEYGPRMEAMQIIPFGTWWDAKARSEADAIWLKARREAAAIWSKARPEADGSWDEARSEAAAICNKVCLEADAIWNKACAAILAKAPERYHAEPWAAQWMEDHP